MYDGAWAEDMKHGRGKYTWSHGGVAHNGQWIDDQPVVIRRSEL